MKRKIYLFLLSSFFMNQLFAQSNEFDVQSCDDEQHQISIIDRDNYIVELSNADGSTNGYGKNPIIRKYTNGQPSVFSTMLGDIYQTLPTNPSPEMHHGSYAIGLVEGKESYSICSAVLNTTFNYPRWEIRLTKVDRHSGQVVNERFIDTGEPIHFRPRVFKSIDGEMLIAGTLDTSNVDTECGMFGIMPTYNHKGYRSEDMFILKIDESFNVTASIKNLSFGGMAEVPFDIEGDGMENFILVGSTRTSDDLMNMDIGIAKIDNSLNSYVAKSLDYGQEEATVIKRTAGVDGTSTFVVGFNHDNSCGIFQMDENLNIFVPMLIRHNVEIANRYVHDLKLNMNDPRKVGVAGYEYSGEPLQLEGSCIYNLNANETVPFYSSIDVTAGSVDFYNVYPPTHDSQQDLSRVYPIQRILTYTEDNTANHLISSVNNSSGKLIPKDRPINYVNGQNSCYTEYCWGYIEYPNFHEQNSDSHTNSMSYMDSYPYEPDVQNMETYFNCNPSANKFQQITTGGIQINKVNNNLSINANLMFSTSGATLTLYNTEGKVVFEKKINGDLYKGENTIDLNSSLSNGLYVLRLNTEHESYSTKVVVQ